MRTMFAALLLLVTALPALAQRLPDTVVPHHYTLWLAPDFKTGTFRGRDTIQVVLKKPTASAFLSAASSRLGIDASRMAFCAPDSGRALSKKPSTAGV